MLPPSHYAEHFLQHGLPLGPFAGPLPYVRTPHGKLHSSRTCPRVTRLSRSRLEAVTVPAAEVTHSVLCGACRDHLPQPAHDHALWARDVLVAVRALADVGVDAGIGDGLEDRCAAADTTPTWRTLVLLGKAAAPFDGFLLRPRTVPDSSMAPVVDDVRALLGRERARIRAVLEGGAAPSGQARAGWHVLAVRPYEPHLYPTTVRPTDELLARAHMAARPGLSTALGFAPPLVASRLGTLFTCHDLGPAGPCDDAAVLETALTLLRADGIARDAPLSQLVACLTQARLIHYPPAPDGDAPGAPSR